MIPTLHSTNRKFEWASALIMLQAGVGFLLAEMAGIRVTGVMPVLTEGWGLSTAQIGILFALAGYGGCYALYANGQWRRWGCYLRAARCVLGFLIYVQLFYGCLMVLIDKRQLLTVLFVWEVLALFEFISAREAIRDCTAYRRVSENAARTS